MYELMKAVRGEGEGDEQIPEIPEDKR